MKDSDYWMTPLFLYDHYKNKNYFDPCPVNPNFDGLKIEWQQFNFCNPPYSEIEQWIDKAILESKKGHKTIMLLPNWTDRKWMKKIINYKFQFLIGRLKFINPKTLKSPYHPRFGSILVQIQ